MQRYQVCQSFIDLSSNCSYLEVGVNEGLTFHQIKASKKVAVDPKFLFDTSREKDSTQTVQYFEVTSDRYFSQVSRQDKFNVIYLDGLHTAEQTLRDLLNAAELLSDRGVIIIDDVKPTSYAASLNSITGSVDLKNALHDPDQSWMGDVYKLAWFINAFMQQWTYYTIADNHGQIVLWRSARDEQILGDSNLEDVARLSFADMHRDSQAFKFKPFAGILEEYKNSLSS